MGDPSEMRSGQLEIKFTPSEIPEGVLIFHSPDGEYLRMEPEGAVYVRGERVDDNQEIYRAMVQWLTTCECVRCGKRVWGKPNSEDV